ncbi:MAG TPA: non-heme iron oxygenase ferredoxin subunit [Xanthobacteraceae bacterium]|nr:non-heme iron oxygenase ferredoxin subunit [Xanthobacteraceae bacterium]
MGATWLRVAALAEIAAAAPLAVKLGDVPIALYRLDDKIYALDDVCPHEFALLSQGFIEGGAIECPLHQACFDIATGRCLSGPATVDLRTYVVKVDGGEVFVRVPR